MRDRSTRIQFKSCLYHLNKSHYITSTTSFLISYCISKINTIYVSIIINLRKFIVWNITGMFIFFAPFFCFQMSLLSCHHYWVDSLIFLNKNIWSLAYLSQTCLLRIFLDMFLFAFINIIIFMIFLEHANICFPCWIQIIINICYVEIGYTIWNMILKYVAL